MKQKTPFDTTELKKDCKYCESQYPTKVCSEHQIIILERQRLRKEVEDTLNLLLLDGIINNSQIDRIKSRLFGKEQK